MAEYNYTFTVTYTEGIPTVFPQTKEDFFIDVNVFYPGFIGDHNKFAMFVCFRSNKLPNLTYHHLFDKFAHDHNINYHEHEECIIADASTLFYNKFPHFK